MSPEEWLAQQSKEQPPAILSPEEWLARQKKEVPAPAKEGPTVLPDTDTSSDFMRGLANYAPQMQETWGAAKALTGVGLSKLGAKETGKGLLESGLESMKAGESKQVARESDSFTRAWEKGIGSVVTDWLPYMIGSGTANIGETLAFMGVGAGVGALTGAGVGALPGALSGAVSKTLIKTGAKEAAEKILKEEGEAAAQKFIQAQAKQALKSAGTKTAMVSQAGIHGAGEVTGRAIEEVEKAGKSAEEIDLTRVVPAAIVHGVADFFINKIGLDALKIGEQASKYLIADIAKRIGVTGLKELPAEEIQTVAERYGASLSLTEAEALREYIDTAAASFGMSVAPGGVGGVRTHLAGKLAAEGKEKEINADVQRTATSAINDAKEVNPPVDPATVAALQPATDENGNALATPAPATVQATKDAETPTAENVTTTEGEVVKTEAQTKAETYITQIDSGEKKANAPTLKGLVKELGLEVEPGKGYSERAVRTIKEHLAGTKQPAGGAGTDVVGQPSNVPAPGGTQGPESSGVAPSGTAVESAAGGEKVQPTPLSEEEQLRAAFELAQQIENQESADKEQAYQESLGAGKPSKYTNITPEMREMYDETREALKEDGVDIPEWDALTGADKDVYFDRIKRNTIEEHDEAARALSDFKEKMGAMEGSLTPAQQRIVNGYDEDRGSMGKLFGMELPAWSELSPNAQLAYLSEVVNNAGLQRERGFEAVADQLEAEGTHVRGVDRATAQLLELKGTEEERRQQAVGEAEQERARAAEAAGKGMPLDDSVVLSLIAGDINGAVKGLIRTAKGLSALQVRRGEKTNAPAMAGLAERWSKASGYIFQFVARSLSKIQLNSTVVMDQNNEVIQRLKREGKLAEYDPKTDTFYFTNEGLDEATLLHEVVHAATVKLINQYLTDPSTLTTEQREAMEHLDKIYQFAQKRLGGKFKNAFENLYEFIGYALTDNGFQNELTKIQSRSLAKYTANGDSLWKNITKMFQKLYGLVTAKGTTLQPQPEVFDELVKQYAPVDVEGLYEEAYDEDGEVTTEVGELTPGQEAQVRDVRQQYKQGKNFLVREPGFEGNLMLELTEIFENILAVPEAGIEVAPLAARQAGAGKKQPLPLRTVDLDKTNEEYDLDVDEKPKNWRYFQKLLGTSEGWKTLATKFQNSRYAIKSWEALHDMAGQIQREGKDKINNIYEQIVLATGDARNFYNVYVSDAANALDKAVGQYARAAGLSTDVALNKLHIIAEALHEPERRLVKFLLTVPLRDDKILNGGKLSPAARREQIVTALDTMNLTEAQAKQLRTELDNLVAKYKDPFGKSPREFSPITVKDPVKRSAQAAERINPDSVEYNVTGMDQASVKKITNQYQKNTHKTEIDAVLAAVQKLHKATSDLNKIANYWSQPVSNRVAFYGFQNYVPLKGNPQHSKVDEELDFDSKRNGRELQEAEQSFDGRVSVSKNPILQTMSDATRAAMRAGRRNLTQSIKNSLKQDKKLNPNGQGILDGYVKKTIKFEERNTVDLKDLKGETTIFHYNPDGSIDILVVKEPKQREAIRQTYKQSNPIVDISNKITSGLGKLHTRYNYQFAPMNFVRDALTNAFTIGAEMGPAQAAKFIKDIATMVVAKNGMYKAMQVAILYERGDAQSQAALQSLAKKDPYIADMVEFIKTGGMVSYLQGMSLKSNFQQLQKEVGRSGILRSVEQVEKFVDIWTDMFELASRSAAYRVAKDYARSRGESERAATVRAVAYSKNLANFEQVGDLGKAMGAFYMFFRPAATGAVRAIEAVAPAFTPMDVALDRLPPNIKSDPKALETFKAEYAHRQQSARIMSASLVGLGMMAYFMAQMFADDDDLGRNAVATDNMQQWTRFARFHIPKKISTAMGLGEDVVFQIPWGFGLGAFAASGAQMAAFFGGAQSFKDMAQNVFLQIALDSFVPIPVSRIPPTEEPVAFFVDSIAPSFVRPVVEFAMNKNGLGQDIFNDATRRFGDAYTGGDRVPEIYKDASRTLADATIGSPTGEIDISPNTLYFLSNSYLDGIGRIAENLHGVTNLAGGKKDFNPKTDIPLIGSFFGTKSNVDSREFSSVEKKIQDIEGKVKMYDTNPEMAARYDEAHPFDRMIVEYYNESVNGQLKELRTQAKEIRLMKDLSPKERADLLKIVTYEQNLVKNQMLETFKAYGMKP